MRDRINELLGKLREEGVSPTSPYLPEIIESLEEMDRSMDAPRERRRKMAGAVGRLVTEDFGFSESALGGEVLQLAEDFASF